ncbi:MAG: chemotaxis protein CheA [Thiotrichaceae bacterium]|nr:chemotaxis protein CheA [Thiotrichaceae bacterium]
MNLDSAQQGYLAECNELLVEMESALLQLEDDPKNSELINAVFRAAHTIKGTGGVFGFDDVVEFTHVVENALDTIRSGDLIINSELVAVFLSLRDQMEIVVEHAVNGETLSSEVKRQNDDLLAALLALTGGEVDEGTQKDESEVNNKDESEEAGACTSNDNWHLSIRFSKDALRDGMDPLSILRYLAGMGDLKQVVTIFSEDDSEELSPIDCHIGLEIELLSDEDKEAIESAFEFIKDDCLVHILPPRAKIKHYINMINALPEEDKRIGEILVSCGALTKAELEGVIDAQTESSFTPVDGDVKTNSLKLGELVEENGMVPKEVVEAAAAKQQRVRSLNSSAKTIRVDSEKLDALVNLVGEMVIAGAGTDLIARRLGDDSLVESMSVMSRLVEEIRDSALRLRMVQIGETFNRFNRVVRDVSSELGKDIRLEIVGAETELDKTVVEKIGDPLMHLVRNAMDHGIESAQDRAAAGKAEYGSLKLNAYHDSGSIVIEVEDDGAGLRRDVILAKAEEKGIVSSGQVLTDQEIYRLIFEPGFSTATEVTNLSGRGVGMDVVKRNIEALRGLVDIESEAGVGTKIIIRMPLTLAIIDGFLVGVGHSSYVIPLDMVFECVELSDAERQQARKQNYINLRDEVLPLMRLRENFNINGESNGRENIVVVQCGGIKAGLIVDELRGEFQTVIKPLGRIFQGLKGISGSTILGSGEVAVILDVPGLVKQVADAGGHLPSAGGVNKNESNIVH